MRNIVDEAGEIIAKATDDHTLIGGHHRLAIAASLGKKLFWKGSSFTGSPVSFQNSFDRGWPPPRGGGGRRPAYGHPLLWR